jgi:hypothetical protein
LAVQKSCAQLQLSWYAVRPRPTVNVNGEPSAFWVTSGRSAYELFQPVPGVAGGEPNTTIANGPILPCLAFSIQQCAKGQNLVSWHGRGCHKTQKLWTTGALTVGEREVRAERSDVDVRKVLAVGAPSVPSALDPLRAAAVARVHVGEHVEVATRIDEDVAIFRLNVGEMARARIPPAASLRR